MAADRRGRVARISDCPPRDYAMFATPIGYLIDERGVIARDVAVGVEPILALADEPTPVASETVLATTRQFWLKWPLGEAASFPLFATIHAEAGSGASRCGGWGRSSRARCLRRCRSGWEPRRPARRMRARPFAIGARRTSNPNAWRPARRATETPAACAESAATSLAAPAGWLVATALALMSSRNFYNFGACGFACDAPGPYEDGACVDGTCLYQCVQGATRCNGACTPVLADPNNCGACGNVCRGSTPYCHQGTCSECYPGTANCGYGYCSDLAWDNANCGACGVVCPWNTYCLAGACHSTDCTPDHPYYPNC